MIKHYGGSTYIFAVEKRGVAAQAQFLRHVQGLGLGNYQVTVLGKDRTIEGKNAVFTDTFAPWDVHFYQISGK